MSPSGAATYTLPIALPPGLAGMAPNLNLVYNSQAGNGLAGQGWELTGLSVIHRCAKTVVQDGRARPINLDYLDDPAHTLAEDDRDGLCLDGRRLFLRDNNTYALEQDDHSVITSQPPAPENPPARRSHFPVV